MLPVCFVNIASFLPMLFGCAVLAAIFGVIGSMFYDMLIKPLKWVSMDKKGVKQLYGRTVAEEQRKNTSILEKIHEFDPLFSYEGFYSEIENILSAVHYAEDPVQVQAFWNNADREQIKEILNEYPDVIDMQVTSVSVQNYEVADGFQRISLRLLCRLLCKNASSVIEKISYSHGLNVLSSFRVGSEKACRDLFGLLQLWGSGYRQFVLADLLEPLKSPVVSILPHRRKLLWVVCTEYVVQRYVYRHHKHQLVALRSGCGKDCIAVIPGLKVALHLFNGPVLANLHYARVAACHRIEYLGVNGCVVVCKIDECTHNLFLLRRPCSAIVGCSATVLFFMIR